MIKSKHIWIGAASLALAGAQPLFAGAQDAPDAHAGHHPAEVSPPPAPAAPVPNPSTPKPDGMMDGTGGGRGNMPMTGMMGGTAMPMGCMTGSGMPMGGDIDGRIASLRTELKITSAQEGAWNAYADVLRGNARRAGQAHAGMMMGSNGAPSPSLTQRLELHQRMLVAGLDNLRALKPALVRLYAGLSVAQKASADRLLACDMRMMPSMPMSGMTRN